MRECVDGIPQSPAPIRIWRLQNRGFCFYSILRSEFCNYAVGPWVSVAGRGTALARGNPAIRKEEARTQKDQVPPGLSHFLIHNSSFIIRTYANPLRSF